jgi:hypothetical protein
LQDLKGLKSFCKVSSDSSIFMLELMMFPDWSSSQ